MAECPDCYGITISILIDAGDGKCNECGGSGLGDGLDQFAASIVNEKSICDKCNGSGECQTCYGTGIIDD